MASLTARHRSNFKRRRVSRERTKVTNRKLLHGHRTLTLTGWTRSELIYKRPMELLHSHIPTYSTHTKEL